MTGEGMAEGLLDMGVCLAGCFQMVLPQQFIRGLFEEVTNAKGSTMPGAVAEWFWGKVKSNNISDEVSAAIETTQFCVGSLEVA